MNRPSLRLPLILLLLALHGLAADAAAQIESRDADMHRHFVHPGLMHTDADFQRMRDKVAAGEEPWKSGWDILTANPRANLDWKARPSERVVRGGQGQNYAAFFNDVHAAYQLALRWKISGDTAYADKAVEILNAWSATLKEVAGNADRFLAAGIYGYQFANAAEIMRTYPGWKREDFGRFQRMMLTIFYPMNRDFLTRHNDAAITNYWANWDLCNIGSMLAIGVLCDRRDIYDEAIAYFKTGRGNGSIINAVYHMHPGNLGQWQESGRDQGHNTLGIALMSPICEMAWNQGDDLYGFENNRLLAGAEYVAKYNLGHEVPYLPYSWGTGQRGDKRTQDVISPAGRGLARAGWEMVYNHYVNRRGIAAPYTAQFAAKVRPEGGGGNYGPNSGGFDQLGFGTVTATIDPVPAEPKPVGVTARVSNSAIVLNWWGTRDAVSYRIKRATKPGGPYTTIAVDVKDLLTFTDVNIAGPAHYYVVTGVLASGKETAASDEIRVATAPELLLHLDFNRDARSAAVRSEFEMNNGATSSAGRTGQAATFDGRDDYIALEPGVVSNLADFTIAAWVHLNESPSWVRIFDFGIRENKYMFLTPRGGDGKARFVVSTVYRYTEQSIDADQPLPTGRWVHVAVTLKGHVGTLYIDGKPAGTNAQIDYPPFQLGNTTQNWIGRSQYPSDPYLDGKVDDFRIYSGALSETEIAELARK